MKLTVVFVLLVLSISDASPLFERQLATFFRDFFLSGGEMDQDDDPTGNKKTTEKFVLPPPLPTESENSPINSKDEKEEKVLVLAKSEEEEKRRRGKRDEEEAKNGGKEEKIKKELSKKEVQEILRELRRNMKGKPLQMRTILDELEAIPGGIELSELINNSALTAIREFFRQVFLSLV